MRRSRSGSLGSARTTVPVARPQPPGEQTVAQQSVRSRASKICNWPRKSRPSGAHRDPDRRQRRPIRPIGNAGCRSTTAARLGLSLAIEHLDGLGVENVSEPDQRNRHDRGECADRRRSSAACVELAIGHCGDDSAARSAAAARPIRIRCQALCCGHRRLRAALQRTQRSAATVAIKATSMPAAVSRSAAASIAAAQLRRPVAAAMCGVSKRLQCRWLNRQARLRGEAAWRISRPR